MQHGEKKLFGSIFYPQCRVQCAGELSLKQCYLACYFLPALFPILPYRSLLDTIYW